MPIFIPVSCLKIKPGAICAESEVGGRWGVLRPWWAMVGDRQEGCREGFAAHRVTCTQAQGTPGSDSGERKRFCGSYTKNTVTEGDVCIFWLLGVKDAPLPAHYRRDLFFWHQCRTSKDVAFCMEGV